MDFIMQFLSSRVGTRIFLVGALVCYLNLTYSDMIQTRKSRDISSAPRATGSKVRETTMTIHTTASSRQGPDYQRMKATATKDYEYLTLKNGRIRRNAATIRERTSNVDVDTTESNAHVDIVSPKNIRTRRSRAAKNNTHIDHIASQKTIKRRGTRSNRKIRTRSDPNEIKIYSANRRTNKKTRIDIATPIRIKSTMTMATNKSTTGFFDNSGKARSNSTMSSNTNTDIDMMTTALCHRTLFGNISIPKLYEWCLYHKKLGFDQVFLFYRPGLDTSPQWEELIDATPWITASEFTAPGRHDGQVPSEIECLSHKAKHYDWVMIADADEYLWFPDRATNRSTASSGPDVKTFLHTFEKKKWTYVSLGKFMYTRYHTVSSHNSQNDSRTTNLPGISKFPFTAGPYCYGPNSRERMGSISGCAGWKGRSKIIAKPKYHKKVIVHGDTLGSIGKGGHLHKNEGHVKEWPQFLVEKNLTMHEHPPQDFSVSKDLGSQGLKEYLRLYSIGEAYRWNDNKTLTITYDSELRDWIESVMAKPVISNPRKISNSSTIASNDSARNNMTRTQ